MKTLVGKIVLFVSLSLAAQLSMAGPFFGWQTTIMATDGANNYSQGVSAPTYTACEHQRLNAINYFASLGYSITSQPHCSPIAFRLPREIILWPEIRWPWPPGPVCLSCPYLVNEEWVHVVYPEAAGRVTKLVEKYNVKAFNEEVLRLEEKFNMQGFSEQMYKLEMEQQMHQQKQQLEQKF